MSNSGECRTPRVHCGASPCRYNEGIGGSKSMNMWIANLHKFSRKFVGWNTAAGPIIAYVLSSLTIIVGVIIYATIIWPHAWWYWISAGLIGLFFSILVERLTLTQAAKVRVASEKREDIKTRYALEEDPTAQTRANEAHELNAVKENWGRVP